MNKLMYSAVMYALIFLQPEKREEMAFENTEKRLVYLGLMIKTIASIARRGSSDAPRPRFRVPLHWCIRWLHSCHQSSAASLCTSAGLTRAVKAARHATHLPAHDLRQSAPPQM
jgi:hypothetical protein